MTRRTAFTVLAGVGLTAASLAASPGAALAATDTTLTSLADRTVGSTVAPNGDTNPYSLSVVPSNYTGGPLAPGDVLVGDVNDARGVQGQGRSILSFHNGSSQLFSTAATAPIASAFNANGTALWVAAYGAADNGTQGSISVLRGTSNPSATPTATIAGDPFPGGVIADDAGPWGVEFNHTGSAPAFFWSNADGSIVRDSKLGMPFDSSSATKNALTKIAQLSFDAGRSFVKGTVVAPQGMAYDPTSDTLYVADSHSDQIVALHGANTSTGLITPTVLLHGGPLHTPQGLAIDPNTGHLLVVNGATNNNLVELSTAGIVVATRNLDPSRGPGALFGLATSKDAAGQTVIYYVNDNTNTLHELTTATTGVHLDGPGQRTAAYASTVRITGTAPAGSTVAVFFHRAGQAGYVQRRSLQASDSGTFSTSYQANDDYRYYAQVGASTTPAVLTQATPTVNGPYTRSAPRNSTVLLSGHAAPNTPVTLHFHRAGTPAGDYSIIRTVASNSNGTWTRPLALVTDQRLYATRGASSEAQAARYLIQAR